MLRADLRRTFEHSFGPLPIRLVRCAMTPGFHAVVVYRFGQWSKRQPLAFRLLLDPLYWLLNLPIQMLWGIELPRGAQIGAGLYISHFGGITVSRLAVIGEDCNLSQSVTIGMDGHGDRAGVPVIGDDVYIGPGARVIGRIRVGNNVKIGANAVVHRDIPDNAVVALDPGFRIISMKGNRRKRTALAA